KVVIDEVRFDGQYLFVQVTHPPGQPVVFVQPEELVNRPRMKKLYQEHRFYEAGKYTARIGPLSDQEQSGAFTLQFFSMADMKRDASMVELRPDYRPTRSVRLQKTPPPIKQD